MNAGGAGWRERALSLSLSQALRANYYYGICFFVLLILSLETSRSVTSLGGLLGFSPKQLLSRQTPRTRCPAEVHHWMDGTASTACASWSTSARGPARLRTRVPTQGTAA